MFKKIAVLFLLLFVVSVSFGQSIPGGTGRHEALGHSPFILDAVMDIHHNPAWNNYYRNYAFGDIGRNIINDFQLSDQYAGATFGVTKKFNLGVVVNRRNDLWNLFNTDGSNIYRPEVNGVEAPIVPVTLLFGYSFSDKFHLGLAPYIARSGYERDSADYGIESNAMSLGADLGFIYMIKKGWIEGNITFERNSYNAEGTLGTFLAKTESDGGIDIGANFRAWIYPSNSSKIAIVPLIGFNMYSWKPKYNESGLAEVVGTEYDWTSFHAGVGMNWPVLDDIQLGGGILGKMNMYNLTFPDGSKIENTQTILPRFYLAGETRIADWLTGRVGFVKQINMWSTDNTGTNDVQSGLIEFNNIGDPTDMFGSEQTISLGAGFHFGRFSIDATVSEKWMKQGINFVSGTQSDLFGVISASYNFNTK